MSENLPQPCPYCGTAPVPFGEKGDYEHPVKAGCFVSGQMIPRTHMGDWNRRNEIPGPAARAFTEDVRKAFARLCEATGLPAPEHSVTASPLGEVPTDAQIASACLSYDHSFGLMDQERRDRLRFQCREWWRSIARAAEVRERS